MKRRKRKHVRKTGKAAREAVARIRRRNNDVWMRLLDIALDARPKKTREIIAEMRANDAKVTRYMGRI